MNNEIKIHRKEIMCPDCSHRFVFSSTYRSDEYIESLKMLEEMANYVDCLKEGYYLKCNCGACKTLDKYRKFKEGLK